MIIGIDIDSTICNTTDMVLEYINERLCMNLKMSDIKDYEIEKFVPQEFKWIVPQAFVDKEMWKKVTMLPNCRDVVERLANDGHEIYFVTSTSANNLYKKVKFLERNFPFLDVNKRLVAIKNKTLFRCNILIDDNYSYFSDDIWHERTYKGICIDYAWNRINKRDPTDTAYPQRTKEMDSFYNVTRVKDWYDIDDKYNELFRS